MKKNLYSLLMVFAVTTLSAQVGKNQLNNNKTSSQLKNVKNLNSKQSNSNSSKFKRSKSVATSHPNNHTYAKANATVIWSDDFNDLDVSDWTVYDKDGDGYLWSAVQSVDDVGNPSGSPLITSASYINNVGPLTPDNWIISPEIDLSAVTEGPVTLKYGVFASDPDWNQENYAVYVSTTNNPTNESDFTLLFTEFDLPGLETERTVDLSAYAGQKIYITFRHFDVTDMYRINIDNVSVVAGVSDDGGNGDHLFYDGFETYNNFDIGGITETVNTGKIGEWTLVDVDGLFTYGFDGITFPNAGATQSFIVFNSKATTPALTPSADSNWSARTGDKTMTSFSSVNGVNNNWLISPNITLGSSDNVLTFYAKAADVDYGYEEFKVLISTTDTQLASFTEIASEAIDSSVQFAEYKYDLSAYNGQNIHIAIQSISNDQFGFIVDDFTVDGSTLSTSETNIKNVTKVYPNPVQDSFKVDFGTSVDKSKLSLDLFNMNGVKVKSFKNANSYDISSLPAGIYVLEINDGKTKTVKKIIKK